jgi:hypothetical protein
MFVNFVCRLTPLQVRTTLSFYQINWGHAVAQLVEALRYIPEGRGLDSRWYQWDFSLTILPAAPWAQGWLSL